jgi:hypothetical protein
MLEQCLCQQTCNSLTSQEEFSSQFCKDGYEFVSSLGIFFISAAGTESAVIKLFRGRFRLSPAGRKVFVPGLEESCSIQAARLLRLSNSIAAK